MLLQFCWWQKEPPHLEFIGFIQHKRAEGAHQKYISKWVLVTAGVITVIFMFQRLQLSKNLVISPKRERMMILRKLRPKFSSGISKHNPHGIQGGVEPTYTRAELNLEMRRVRCTKVLKDLKSSCPHLWWAPWPLGYWLLQGHVHSCPGLSCVQGLVL